MSERLELSSILEFVQSTNVSRCVREGEAILAANRLIKCGVKNRNNHEIELKALCLQTGSCNEPPHTITGVIFNTQGVYTIRRFHCTCKAGASQCCKHCVATMLYCNRHKIEELEILSATNVPCNWKKCKKKSTTVHVPFRDYCHSKAVPVHEYSEEQKKQFREEVVRLFPETEYSIHHRRFQAVMNQQPTRFCSRLVSRNPKIMSVAKKVVSILHFNDVYNVEEQQQEPIAGANRFCTALKSFADLDPLVLFSGDILAPSIMSTFTKGEQMLPVLEACHVSCACYGNHDFDFGVDNLMEFARRTSFPWLISNVLDNGTSAPLADGKVSCILNKNGIKFGIVGLVEEEWLATLATIDPEDVTYIDFVTEGRKLAKQLKDKMGVDYVIALTHMRTPNDCRLAENVDEIDLILGGHDHVYEIKKVNGKFIIKSGTDFREFSKISLDFSSKPVRVDIEKIEVTSKFHEDEDLKQQLAVYNDIVAGKMDEILGQFSTDLDARFSSIRTMETNIGNFVADVMLSSTHSDLAILNSGTLRADRLIPKGDFTLRDLVNLLPMMDPMIVLNAPGENIYLALENGVSQYPKLEGRFPQVSGISFAFDPKKPPGSRIDPRYIKIGDEYLDMNQKYRLSTKMYMFQGRDGYDMFKECEVLLSEEESPELRTAVQNHFDAIKVVTGAVHHKSRHRQSLVCLSRRHSVVKMFEESSQPSARAPLKRGFSLDAVAKRNLFKIQDKTSIDKVEHEQCKLEPKPEDRIIVLTEEVREQLEKNKQEYIGLTVDPVIEEDEDEN